MVRPRTTEATRPIRPPVGAMRADMPAIPAHMAGFHFLEVSESFFHMCLSFVMDVFV